MNYLVKQPTETFPIGIDYTGQLPSGYTLLSATVSAINKATLTDATNVILLSPTCSIDLVEEQTVCVVTGGVLNTDYAITILLTLSPSGTISDTVTVAVRNC
jgi:hypothetical protein